MLINRLELMPRDIEDDIRADAVARYPEESIGVIRRGQYEAIPNVAGQIRGADGKFLDPCNVAVPDPETFQNMLIDGDVDALVHSHPDGVFGPSAHDMRAQIDHGIPYGVVGVYKGGASRVALWGDQLERMPLLDRGFQHGITDCYEAIRDKYFVGRGWWIEQFARDWDWWKSGQTLYESGFRQAGFEKVPSDQAQEWDVVMFKIRSETHNHAGIYLGNGLLYHHATAREPYDPGKRATIEPIHRWLKYDAMYVRPDENHQAIRKVGQEIRGNA